MPNPACQRATDYYQVFGIDSCASPDQIKSAYRKLVKEWHPDRFQDQTSRFQATEKIQELNAAYEILKHPQRRAQYDQSQRHQKPPVRAKHARPSRPGFMKKTWKTIVRPVESSDGVKLEIDYVIGLSSVFCLFMYLRIEAQLSAVGFMEGRALIEDLVVALFGGICVAILTWMGRKYLLPDCARVVRRGIRFIVRVWGTPLPSRLPQRVYRWGERIFVLCLVLTGIAVLGTFALLQDVTTTVVLGIFLTGMVWLTFHSLALAHGDFEKKYREFTKDGTKARKQGRQELLKSLLVLTVSGAGLWYFLVWVEFPLLLAAVYVGPLFGIFALPPLLVWVLAWLLSGPPGKKEPVC